MRDFTNDEVIISCQVFNKESALWATRAHLPARNGLSTADWMEVQRKATYDLLRDGVVVMPNLPDALGEPELFRQRDLAAMRAAIHYLGSLAAPEPIPGLSPVPQGDEA